VWFSLLLLLRVSGENSDDFNNYKNYIFLYLITYILSLSIKSIIVRGIDQLTLRFQLLDFQPHAPLNLLFLRDILFASLQQIFVLLDAFFRQVFRDLRVVVEIRRPDGLHRRFDLFPRFRECRVNFLFQFHLLFGGYASFRVTRSMVVVVVGVGVERARLRSDDVRATRVGETKATKKRRAKHLRFLIFCAEKRLPFCV